MFSTDQIINGEKIIERFGLWPSFHDGEVISLHLARTNNGHSRAEMLIHTWLMTTQVDALGYFVSEKHSLIHLAFEEMLQSQFTDFNHQNCLDSLSISQKSIEGQSALRVDFPTNYGLEGYVICRRVVVIDVQPCDDKGIALQSKT